MPETNGWTEWGRHVLSELERLNGCIEALSMRLREFEIEQTILKVKAGMWGLVAGFIPVAVTILIMFLSGSLRSITTPSESRKVAESEYLKIEKRIDELKQENEKLKRQIERLDVRHAEPPGQK
jgi:pyruvate/2-oxoacid:ferredoxin oxidoreductase beta subunit